MRLLIEDLLEDKTEMRRITERLEADSRAGLPVDCELDEFDNVEAIEEYR